MIWFAIALVALVLEVFSGTFYLLVLSIACAITGVLDWAFHTPFAVNITVCAVLSIIGIVLATYWHKKKRVIPMSDNTAYDDLDIGQSVAVIAQNQDGSYRVQYRGAEWQAISSQALNSKNATIVGKQGNMLVVE
ncbi:MAG: NfeD family protein [Neisseriaceae bacterium]|nr:NfeD family protein [Neisseriaceae bacterium]